MKLKQREARYFVQANCNKNQLPVNNSTSFGEKNNQYSNSKVFESYKNKILNK